MASAFTSDVPIHRTDEYKAEARKVTRCWMRYDSSTIANLRSSHRLGHRQRQAIGEYFYVHEDRPNVAFPTRKSAVTDALRRMGLDVDKRRR